MFNFFRSKSFTKHWEFDGNRQYEFELSNCTFCGVRLNTPVSSLDFMGPSNRINKWSGVLTYQNQGLEFDFDTETLQYYGIGIIYIDSNNEGFSPYQGNLTYHGREMEKTLEHVKNCLGEPDEVEEDDEEIMITYDDNLMVKIFEFTLDHQLKQVLINLILDQD